MDIEQMKKDLGGGNVFPIGEENVVFAKYFTGECYLNMLTTERVPVGLVTFAPGTITMNGLSFYRKKSITNYHKARKTEV